MIKPYISQIQLKETELPLDTGDDDRVDVLDAINEAVHNLRALDDSDLNFSLMNLTVGLEDMWANDPELISVKSKLEGAMDHAFQAMEDLGQCKSALERIASEIKTNRGLSVNVNESVEK